MLVEVVSLGLPEIEAEAAVTPVPFLHPESPGALLEKVISAQLNNPPSGSPLVMT